MIEAIEGNECPLDRLVLCPECGGNAVVDSGGQTAWGSWINVPCPLCYGKPITEREVREAGWSPWVPDTNNGSKCIDKISQKGRHREEMGAIIKHEEGFNLNQKQEDLHDEA